MRLLVTRPEADGERTAAALRAHGHEATVAALLRVEAIVDAELGAGPYAGAIVTSANAARAVAFHARRAELTRLPLYAVGRRTAEAARAAGFTDVASADGAARDLVRRIAARAALASEASGQRGNSLEVRAPDTRPEPGSSARAARAPAPLVYLAGEDRAVDLEGELAAQGVAVRTAVVYRTVAATAFPAEVEQDLATGTLDGVLHFSRRSAEAYLQCADAAGLRDAALVPMHYCLSPRVVEPLTAAGAFRLRVAWRPDEAALLALL